MHRATTVIKDAEERENRQREMGGRTQDWGKKEREGREGEGTDRE